MSSTHAMLRLERPFSRQLRLSAPAYFLSVALTTTLGFGLLALLRPTLAHSIREWFETGKRLQATPNSFYAVRVAPLFEEHCIGCHGARRQKGKLRLDSFAAVMRGGKHGAVVRPGSVKESELVSRITLPVSNDRVMPPASRLPLTADDVTVIKLWIRAGASRVQAAGAVKGAPPLVVEVKFPEIDEAAVEKQRATLSRVVRQLQTRFPNLIAYESRGSADLQINASLMGATFDDASLAALTPLRDRIVWLDLSGTSVTDASASAVGTMKHLRVLRLRNTKVTDLMIQALASLTTLQSLTIVGTSVTAESLRALRNKGIKIFDDNF